MKTILLVYHAIYLNFVLRSLLLVEVSESSQWPKVGIMMGMKPSLGHFDECVMVNAYNITGQHCLVESKISFKEYAFVTPKYPLDTPPEESSAWLALQMVCTRLIKEICILQRRQTIFFQIIASLLPSIVIKASRFANYLHQFTNG